MSAPVSAETGGGAPTETSPEVIGDPNVPAPPAEESTGSAPAPQAEQNVQDVDALRAELDEWRSKAEGQQGVVDKIAAALGIGTAGTPPTVEQVTEQLATAQTEARERAVDLAVFRAAPAANADPDALLDSTAFRRRVADLDPADAKFGEQVAAAIADAVKANPRLAATSAAPQRSGGEITGGSPTTSDDLGSLSVEDYIKRTRKRGN